MVDDHTTSRRLNFDGTTTGAPDQYQDKAKEIVWEFVRSQYGTTQNYEGLEIYVVWFAKTLQNWKALLSTNIADGAYYEVTYDGDKKRAYLDVYKKVHNATRHD